MKVIYTKAYAKLNLSLDVLSKRPDGYHDLCMVMQSVEHHDDVSILLNMDGQFYAQSDRRYLPNDERNIALKAARLFLEETGHGDMGASVRLRKRIPVCAGLGGGSSDAAAVLRALNRLFDRRLSRRELEELACAVGSDVAFCVAGGTALAEGRGEKLTDLPPMPDCFFVICKPAFSISTPELYRKLDSAPVRIHPDTPGLLSAVREGDLTALCRRMYNVFEEIDDRRLRTVTEIKSRLLDHRALSAMMTGTGSAVFGVFQGEAEAREACAALRPDYKFCCVSRPVGRIVDFPLGDEKERDEK